MTSEPSNLPVASRRDVGEFLIATLAAALAGTATAARAASDIDPQSGSRLGLPHREELDPDAQRVFDRATDPRGGSIRGLRGPTGIQLHSPKLAALLQPLLGYLRMQSGIPDPVREVAILAAARGSDNQFEFAAHEGTALKAGVSAPVIHAVRSRKSTAGLDPVSGLVIELYNAAFERHRVSSELYARAVKQFGEKQLIDLVALMGYYIMTAGLLTTFDMQLDAGTKPPLPGR